MKGEKKISLSVVAIIFILVISVFYREARVSKIEQTEKIEQENQIECNLEEENQKQEDEHQDCEDEPLESIGNEEKLTEDLLLENQISKDEIDENLVEEKNLENMEYTIKKGDTISELSMEYKIKSEYIYANNIDKNLRVLQIGKKIKIPTEAGIFYSVQKGDSFEKISEKFEVEIETIKNDNSMDVLLVGSTIFLREPKVSKYLTAIKSDSTNNSIKMSNSRFFSNPLAKMQLTSGFGTRNHPVLKKVLTHGAIDLAAKTGTRVSAASEGTVTFAGTQNGYGKIVIIKHRDGFETRYAHLSQIHVKKNQKISQNQLIGLSGATGRVSGPHLHFEIRQNGKVKNPLNYLKI